MPSRKLKNVFYVLCVVPSGCAAFRDNLYGGLSLCFWTKDMEHVYPAVFIKGISTSSLYTEEQAR